MPAGYSGTPLPQKLGIQKGHRVGLQGPPDGFESTLGSLPAGASLVPALRGRDHEVSLLFARDAKTLARDLPRVKARMAFTSALWICWPKKTSPLASELTENDVRAAGLDAGLVDVKICAIDEDWSGLKFVYRLKDRPTTPTRKK